MQKENINVYKKLICDMVMDSNDGKFLRQMYSCIAKERRLYGRLQQDLHDMIDEMGTDELRLLWIAAKELRKK